jgi:hypothetical protein
MMGAINIFEKNNFKFNIVVFGLFTKSLGAGCTFEEMAEKTNCPKMNVKFLQSN